MGFPEEIQTALTRYYQQKSLFKRFLFRYSPSIAALQRLKSIDRDNLYQICLCFINHLPKKSSLSYPVYQTVLKQLKVPEAEAFIHAMITLQKVDLLTLKNFEQVKAHQLIIGLAYALDKLEKAHLLTSQNFSFILSSASPGGIADVLVELNKAGSSFASTYFDLIKTHRDPKGLAAILGLLNKMPAILLTLQTFEAIFAHPKPWILGTVLNLLSDLPTNLLTETSLSWLLNSNHYWLCTTETYEKIWARIPSHALNTSVLEQLMVCSKKQSLAHLEYYVNTLLKVSHSDSVSNNDSRLRFNPTVFRV